MPTRKRMIQPDVWSDCAVLMLSIPSRLLFIGMITQADDYGYGDAAPRALKARIFPGDNVGPAKIKKLIKELIDGELAELSANGLVYRLPSWGAHQKLRLDYEKDGKWKNKWEKYAGNPSLDRHATVTPPSRHRHAGKVGKVGKVKLSSKEIKESPAPPDSENARKQKQPNQEFDAVRDALSKKTRKQPKPATVQGILTQCARLDWNPLDLIEVADVPYAVLMDVAQGRASPDDWADQVKGWGKFQDGVYRSNSPSLKNDSGPESIGKILEVMK